MLLLRGLVLALSFFFIAYVALSGTLAAAWRVPLLRVRLVGSRWLFALRFTPMVVAFSLVGLLVVPSFLRLEPHGADEVIGLAGTAAAIAGALILCFGIANPLLAWHRTRRLLAANLRPSAPFIHQGRSLGVRVAVAQPTLLVVGVYRPTLLISDSTVDLLSAGELRAALRHELAHIHRRDNLKKLLLQACIFPGLAGMDRSCLQYLELHADEDSLADRQSALDLASALLKMARAAAPTPLPDLAIALVSAEGSLLSRRIHSLLAWTPAAEGASRPSAITFVLAATLVLALANYTSLLRPVYEFSEALIR